MRPRATRCGGRSHRSSADAGGASTSRGEGPNRRTITNARWVYPGPPSAEQAVFWGRRGDLPRRQRQLQTAGLCRGAVPQDREVSLQSPRMVGARSHGAELDRGAVGLLSRRTAGIFCCVAGCARPHGDAVAGGDHAEGGLDARALLAGDEREGGFGSTADERGVGLGQGVVLEPGLVG